MNIMLVIVPYDLGHRCMRRGCGPDQFLGQGLEAVLQEGGHGISIFRIEPRENFIARSAPHSN